MVLSQPNVASVRGPTRNTANGICYARSSTLVIGVTAQRSTTRNGTHCGLLLQRSPRPCIAPCAVQKVDRAARLEDIKRVLVSKLGVAADALQPNNDECERLSLRSVQLVEARVPELVSRLEPGRVSKLLTRVPGTILSVEPNTLVDRFHALGQMLGVSMDEVVDMIVKTPKLLARSHRSLEARLDKLAELLGDRPRAQDVLWRTPGVMQQSTETLEFKMVLLRQAAAGYLPWEGELEQLSSSKLGFLLTRGTRSLLRLQYLVEKGEKRRLALRTVVARPPGQWDEEHPDFQDWLARQTLPGPQQCAEDGDGVADGGEEQQQSAAAAGKAKQRASAGVTHGSNAPAQASASGPSGSASSPAPSAVPAAVKAGGSARHWILRKRRDPAAAAAAAAAKADKSPTAAVAAPAEVVAGGLAAEDDKPTQEIPADVTHGSVPGQEAAPEPSEDVPAPAKSPRQGRRLLRRRP
ncbi:hypothetical protein Agub_g3083 [Astrephomene gubernaculifera]|uniref:Uncharacterized protein n=1 Tax=Astrephomene gubernaculifera TaxID=47775 RepID=A0AAD3DIJ7_9CHLO|nr:hypothetical protein Agub_g3083 [Astrephomene gubernaculifera]